MMDFSVFEGKINSHFVQPMKLTELKETFTNSLPFPHLELDQFFDEDFLIAIIEEIQEMEFEKKDSDLFQFLQTDDLETLPSEKLREFKKFLASEAFITWIEKVTGLNLSREKIDATVNLYSDTDYLLCHDDNLPGRKVAFIIYLSDLEKGEGGSLNLYESIDGRPTKVVKSIRPKFNKFVFFQVLPNSFHEVDEVIGEAYRATITGWFYEN